MEEYDSEEEVIFVPETNNFESVSNDGINEVYDTNIDFIRAVEARPWLWDTNNPDYYNRSKITSSWKEIRKEFAGDVQKRWRNLRTSYLRSKRNQTMLTDSGLKYVKPYKYTDHMAFLADFITMKKPTNESYEDSEEAYNDNVEFIRAVEARPLLWDRTHINFRDRVKVTKAWEDIRTEFPGDVIKRWRNLRNGFMRWKKNASLPSKSKPNWVKPYKYEDHLTFLTEIKSPQTPNSGYRTEPSSPRTSISSRTSLLDSETVLAAVERVDEKISSVLPILKRPYAAANELFGSFVTARLNELRPGKAARVQLQILEALNEIEDE